MTARCDLCSRPLKWHEVVIAYHNKTTDRRFVECLPCAEENPDTQKREGVEWEIHEYGETLTHGKN